ncbi:MAG TPA: hypothetical protein VD978_29540 [Azospirillum sp.]|nr:hypothetical protein [Azospirillum sp.]
MALLVILFDRPADLDGTGYRERSRNWIAEIVRQDGFVEFSAHWNALQASPSTMVVVRLASTEAATKALSGPAMAHMLEDMTAHGCRNIAAHAFRSSEIFPEPIIR